MKPPRARDDDTFALVETHFFSFIVGTLTIIVQITEDGHARSERYFQERGFRRIRDRTTLRPEVASTIDLAYVPLGLRGDRVREC